MSGSRMDSANWGFGARMHHAACALIADRWLRRATYTTIAVMLAAALPIVLMLVPPGYGGRPVERDGRTYRPTDDGYQEAIRGIRQDRAALGAPYIHFYFGLLGAIALGTLASIREIPRAQLRGKPWACRYPLRLSLAEWRALEKIIEESGFAHWRTGEPHMKVRGAAHIFRLADTEEQRERLANYLLSYDKDLPRELSPALVLALAVSLRVGAGTYYLEH